MVMDNRGATVWGTSANYGQPMFPAFHGTVVHLLYCAFAAGTAKLTFHVQHAICGVQLRM